ncbi:queuosine salvage protein-like [Actinia tenebrosa]|uniref:Queuosine 5'-phosphate N-glycosylase/hydrolase n=1 Tax=Actinia tenebrosa TaxID=6105 RepID=A0A6P8IWX9_ACTTE|nr:queuosine salvage protein-like [Actinia tenebrosa]
MDAKNSALCPRRSAELISTNSKDVSISQHGVVNTSKIIFDCLKTNKYSFKVWKEHELHPKEMNKETVDWIFVLDCLNFSFWVDDEYEPWKVSFEGKDYEGYWALCAGINRALKEGIPLTKPSFFATITTSQLQHIFRSETSTKMPLLKERAEILNEAGKFLMENYQGSFANMISKCNHSAQKLLKLITTSFRGFRDEGTFNNHKVSFYKRAQILIADIWACFEGKTWGSFDDIEIITMFADYKVPQSLLHLKVLEYSSDLMDKLRMGKTIPPGNHLEMEIRGNSIWAVEHLYQTVKKMALNDKEFACKSPRELAQCLNSVIIDFYLWDFAKEKVEKITDLPCHKTRTIFY